MKNEVQYLTELLLAETMVELLYVTAGHSRPTTIATKVVATTLTHRGVVPYEEYQTGSCDGSGDRQTPMMIGDVWISPAMVPELSKSLGLHRTTIQRWLTKRKIPSRIYALLDITENGNLARIHPDWEAWHINPKSGELVSPGVSCGRRLAVNPGKIMSIELRTQQITALQLQNEELRIRCKKQEAIIAELENYLRSISERNAIE